MPGNEVDWATLIRKVVTDRGVRGRRSKKGKTSIESLENQISSEALKSPQVSLEITRVLVAELEKIRQSKLSTEERLISLDRVARLAAHLPYLSVQASPLRFL